MSTITTPKATLADLAAVEEKAELISGRIHYLMPTGYRPSRIAFRIARSLDDFARSSGRGNAFGDNVGYAVPELASGRESFSPDASFTFGEAPDDDMDFVPGAPEFAVEVRSKSDYDAAAESARVAKRADYFEAGTKVVWDVDPVGDIIDLYDHRTPDQAVRFSAGQIAHAEPWLPGWAISIDELFVE